MSVEYLLRGFFAAFLAAAVAYGVYKRNQWETDLALEQKKQRYAPLIPGYVLPYFFLLLAVFSIAVLGAKTTAGLMFSLCFVIFLHISVYYVLLLLMLPLLRKHISARACAMLWLVPNCLYFTQMGGMALPKPRWILRLPETALRIVFCVWLTGFFAVLLWKTASHLMFRRRLLKNAQPVTDPAVLELWTLEQRRAHMKKTDLRLVVSPDLKTPLSIGFFRRTIRVVLPEKPYTADELGMIFRHEIIHIGRTDSTTKFFMVFCTAMCWFNPLMWIAMRRSADDMELSCDETVLLNASEETRRMYADLLLRTAGDERGFTTSLSASAAALRYRLKNIVKPRKRFLGGIVVGLTLFLVIMSCGYVALAYDEASGAEYIFDSMDTSAVSIQSIRWSGGEVPLRVYDSPAYRCQDPAALICYLSGLRFSRISGNYTFPAEENYINIIFEGPPGVFGMTLQDDRLSVTALYQEKSQQSLYYAVSKIDWAYIGSLLMPCPEDVSGPFPPDLMLYFNDEINQNGEPMFAISSVLSITIDGEEQPPETWQYLSGSGVGGVYNYAVTEVTLTFSQEPQDGYSVQIEDWNRETEYWVSSQELEDPGLLPLAPYSAHYTVYASFALEENRVCEMKYVFDIQFTEK